jgi:hypothetical protein
MSNIESQTSTIRIRKISSAAQTPSSRSQGARAQSTFGLQQPFLITSAIGRNNGRNNKKAPRKALVY